MERAGRARFAAAGPAAASRPPAPKSSGRRASARMAAAAAAEMAAAAKGGAPMSGERGKSRVSVRLAGDVCRGAWEGAGCVHFAVQDLQLHHGPRLQVLRPQGEHEFLVILRVAGDDLVVVVVVVVMVVVVDVVVVLVAPNPSALGRARSSRPNSGLRGRWPRPTRGDCGFRPPTHASFRPWCVAAVFVQLCVSACFVSWRTRARLSGMCEPRAWSVSAGVCPTCRRALRIEPAPL